MIRLGKITKNEKNAIEIHSSEISKPSYFETTESLTPRKQQKIGSVPNKNGVSLWGIEKPQIQRSQVQICQIHPDLSNMCHTLLL